MKLAAAEGAGFGLGGILTIVPGERAFLTCRFTIMKAADNRRYVLPLPR
jgi:hypothetical protein